MELHELLAIEETVKQAANSKLTMLQQLFTNGIIRFTGQARTYAPLEEKGESFAPEVSELGTTIDAELESAKRDLAEWIDLAITKDATNQKANADVVVDGTVLLTGVPATALLSLEKKLTALINLYKTIPVNDPNIVWKFDPQNNWYVSEPTTTYRTKKVIKPAILYEATKEHPAQVKEYSEDVRQGTWTTVYRSGALSPSDKTQRLKRLEALYKAVLQARMRANKAEVEMRRLGEIILDYINK